MQGSSPRMDRVSRLVNLGTRARRRPSSRSADNRGVPLWHELGCYAGAGSAVAKVFADGLGRAGSKQRGAVALIDRAGASSSPPSSSRMDDEHESRRVADVERGSRSLVVRSESLGRAAQTLGSSRIASEQH
jgi:hypothetical protein